MILYLDFETFSEADLTTVNTTLYSRHPSTEILLAGYAVNDDPVEAVRLDYKTRSDLGMLIMLADLIVVHNVEFEWNQIVNVYHLNSVPYEKFFCTQMMAAQLNLPMSLDKLGEAVHLEHRKLKTGKALMNRFSKPFKPTKAIPKTRCMPEDDPKRFEQYIEYCRQDVEAMREFYLKYRKYNQVTSEEREVQTLSHKINQQGIPIDLDTAKRYYKLLESSTKPKIARFRKVTGFNPTQTAKVLKWVNAWIPTEKDHIPNLQADTIKQWLEGYTWPTVPKGLSRVKEALEIRQELSKTSNHKIKKIIQGADKNGRVHDTLRYHGASTGRWSGWTQSFPKLDSSAPDIDLDAISHLGAEEVEFLYGSVPELISRNLRRLIKAPEGKFIIAADYAAIEARGVCWLAGQEDILKQYREGKSTYKDLASKIYRTPVDQIEKGSTEYFVGKTGILGCGYGMGSTRFEAQCAKNGVQISKELSNRAVSTYRSTHWQVVELWKAVENTIKIALKHPNTSFPCHEKISISYEPPFLFITLPSDRRISFYSPRIVPVIAEHNGNTWETEQIQYWGKIQGSENWNWIPSWGGSFVESICQGTCRDLMAHGMLEADRLPDFELFLTVHDEIVAESATPDIRLFTNLITHLPPWAEDFPLEAEGYAALRYGG